MLKSYKLTSKDKVSDIVNDIFGVTKDKDGKEIYPDYCRNCKFAKSRYDHSEAYCSNRKSESYKSRVRSWDTACELYKTVINLRLKGK